MRDDIVGDRPWSTFETDLDPMQALLEQQDGVISWWQARRLISEKALRHRIARGRWRRIHCGVYVSYGGRLTVQQRMWVAVLSVRPEPNGSLVASLGGLTALIAHDLKSIAEPRIHMIVPQSRRVIAPAGVVTHRVLLPALHRHPHMRPPATTAGRALVDAAAWARSDDEARLIIAASFQQRLVTADDVYPVLDRMINVRRRELIVTTVRDCAAGSHSVGELDLVALCRSGRLPLPTRQVRHRDNSGRLRYLDARFDPWRVVVEVDGAHHADVGQMWDDSARQNDLILADYKVLRYPAFVLRTQPLRVIAEIRAALIAAGWCP